MIESASKLTYAARYMGKNHLPPNVNLAPAQCRGADDRFGVASGGQTSSRKSRIEFLVLEKGVWVVPLPFGHDSDKLIQRLAGTYFRAHLCRIGGCRACCVVDDKIDAGYICTQDRCGRTMKDFRPAFRCKSTFRCVAELSIRESDQPPNRKIPWACSPTVLDNLALSALLAKIFLSWDQACLLYVV